MDTNIQIFENPAFGKVRVVMVNEIPYFVGNDIAKALGYVAPRNAVAQHVDEWDALKQCYPDNQGVMQETTIISEAGVYALIFGSKLPKAKEFKKWVCGEVLPAINN
jgi:prophage antirepressor-like protein